MAILEVGKKYPALRGRAEGVYFDIDDAGAKLFYNFGAPTKAEIESVQANQPFEIRFIELDGLIWVTSKCGTLNWSDAPYNPRTSLVSNGFARPEPGCGLALTLAMVDANSSKVKSLRLIGLPHDFSAELINHAIQLRDTKMLTTQYKASIARTMSRYSSDALAQVSPYRYRMKGE